MADLLPLFVNLRGRRVLVVGGGPVAVSKLAQLRATGADMTVVAPELHADIRASGVPIKQRPFEPADLDGIWLVVAAGPPDVNRYVAQQAESRQIFVNAVDDPKNASAFLSGVIRRDAVTIAISTDGQAPALTSLLREALDDVLPEDLGTWMRTARQERASWKRRRVPMRERRPLLLEALVRMYLKADPYGAGESLARAAEGTDADHETRSVPTVGHVSLVGAGPGDPGLLTRRAVARLRRADLVLYDALVDERVVRLARRAQRFYVGKRAGHAAIAQKDIHAAMIGAAQRGRRVVRLKGGDPFVFGRGGEEALALLQAGIPFDIVPGVTSAVAAPALAGIPVTHRGVSGALVVVSGHDTAAFSEMIRGLRPDALTLVVLMGRSHLPELAGILLRRDWPESQPVAVIVDASTSNQYVWRGTLKALSESNVLPDRDGATMFVVGSVAALALERADDSAVAESGTPVSPKPVHIGHRG